MGNKTLIAKSNKEILDRQIKFGLNEAEFDYELDSKHNYLLTEALQTRYVIAADQLKSCDHIVEIGCFQTPIYNFLTFTPKSVTVIDPLTEDLFADHLRGKPCKVRHVKSLFQDYEFDLEPGSYGVAMLGFALIFQNEDDKEIDDCFRALSQLINNAKKTFIEFNPSFSDARRQVRKLSGMISATETRSFDLDLSHDKNAVYHNPRMSKRYLYRSIRVFKGLEH